MDVLKLPEDCGCFHVLQTLSQNLERKFKCLWVFDIYANRSALFVVARNAFSDCYQQGHCSADRFQFFGEFKWKGVWERSCALHLPYKNFEVVTKARVQNCLTCEVISQNSVRLFLCFHQICKVIRAKDVLVSALRRVSLVGCRLVGQPTTCEAEKACQQRFSSPVCEGVTGNNADRDAPEKGADQGYRFIQFGHALGFSAARRVMWRVSGVEWRGSSYLKGVA
jgi:hypothetical protein